MRIQAAAVTALLLAGCQPRQAGGPPAPARVLEGDFTVSYEVRLSDTSTGGRSDLRTKRITFGEGYIVVGDETGGRVFPIDRLIRFTWRAAEE